MLIDISTVSECAYHDGMHQFDTDLFCVQMLVVKQARKHVGSLLATQTFNSELYTDSFRRGCIRSNSSNSASFTKTYVREPILNTGARRSLTHVFSIHWQPGPRRLPPVLAIDPVDDRQGIVSLSKHRISGAATHFRNTGAHVINPGAPLQCTVCRRKRRAPPTSIPVHSPESFGRKHCNPDICYIWVHNFAYILSALELPFLSTVANPCVILLP
ncbi:hypothetical protein DFJ43DRAFT_563509 [Lentinula guzmanii]|uniref:Uncharacterized protein n=1 Tax=Lentinula guzmanii TaxID=2804957 RepID=A0AA38JBU4_9AGAR|nr:hypothetical protein DFJ43DRAFT_563509 [Lentinula guzmanii]